MLFEAFVLDLIIPSCESVIRHCGEMLQVKDEDMGTDKLLGVTSISLHDLEPHSEVEITKKLLRSLDTDRVKDKGDRGTVTVKVSQLSSYSG